MYIETKAATV